MSEYEKKLRSLFLDRDLNECVWIGDSHHKGTVLIYGDLVWICVDLEEDQVTRVDHIALVRCAGNPDDGLCYNVLACDLDDEGLYVVDIDYYLAAPHGYLHLLWASDGTTVKEAI